MFEESKLQDIEETIKLVEKERNSRLDYILNRFSCPFMMFKSTDEWLEILNFERKQQIEKIVGCKVWSGKLTSPEK